MILSLSHPLSLTEKVSPSQPCGRAGGAAGPTPGHGEFTNTTFAKFGDLGSVVLPKQFSGAVWPAGSVQETVSAATVGLGCDCCRADERHYERLLLRTALDRAHQPRRRLPIVSAAILFAGFRKSLTKKLLAPAASARASPS